eukprot:814433-Amphidinium_carterae.1
MPSCSNRWDPHHQLSLARLGSCRQLQVLLTERKALLKSLTRHKQKLDLRFMAAMFDPAITTDMLHSGKLRMMHSLVWRA